MTKLHPVVFSLLLPAASAAGQTATPWHAADIAPPSQAPRIMLWYDMEGLAGVTNGRMTVAAYPGDYARGRDLLVGDVNAVVDGLFAGGAASVTVVDYHGSGNSDGPDLPESRLDPRASFIRPAELRSGKRWTELGLWDALVFVGMHEATATDGFLAHTGAPGTEYRLNGESLTETEILALRWGAEGVPVIFVSGDDRLGEHLERIMPWAEYVSVKEAVTPDSALPRPLPEVRLELRNKAERAVGKLALAKALQVNGPITATLRALPPADLSSLDGVPGVAYRNQEITFTAENVYAATDGLGALARVARMGYLDAFIDQLKETPGGEELVNSVWDAAIAEGLRTVDSRPRYPDRKPR